LKCTRAKLRILLLGANGQVGHELQWALTALGEVVALSRSAIDFSVTESLRTAVRRYRPSVIVNAAAYTAVDKAEADEAGAVAVNATAPGVLAEEADALGAVLVHYSTDYVFDGNKGAPYVETDETAPLSVYGHSKRDGELAVERCRKHLILRTSWVSGAHGQNFLKTILRIAKDRRDLRVVNDQVGTPTSATLLADLTVDVLAKLVGEPAADSRWGLYHLVAGGETSWHGLASHIISQAGRMGFSLRASAKSIAPISTAEFPTPARRPADSRLATSKFQQTFAVTLPDWTVGVDAVIHQLAAEARR
jgi:dTDP-4-dehydrorhamnose reductase